MARLLSSDQSMQNVGDHGRTTARGGTMSRWAGALLLFLVTVMFGGASLLRFLISGDVLDDWQVDQFRAGHAHGGVLLILALVYVVFLERTRWSPSQRRLAMITLLVGGISQSGGFFLHMLVGEHESFSAGTALTLFGAVLLATAVISLGVSLIRDNQDKEWTV